ncbi:hypothetical protein I553_4182 [Mycobacterium xenopi 4042]|uniref:Uncharacterized protein n=1 Tax=Mycobacterium xenopi 4042 TaxID=1299334 RepID=X8AFY4_MYCXE|nr:hypothetical protein I553_4182 [Mycobacterium xenopi 4042]
MHCRRASPPVRHEQPPGARCRFAVFSAAAGAQGCTHGASGHTRQSHIAQWVYRVTCQAAAGAPTPVLGNASATGRTAGVATVQVGGTDNAPILFASPSPADTDDADDPPAGPGV